MVHKGLGPRMLILKKEMKGRARGGHGSLAFGPTSEGVEAERHV